MMGTMEREGKRTSHSWAEKRRHRIRPSHLLKDGDEKSDLNLSRMLEKTVKSGCALCFRENFEPYSLNRSVNV